MSAFFTPSFGAETLTIQVVILRIVIALILGGFIGIERGIKNRPAGFRTHILVCIGACLVMITNEYIFIAAGGASDPTRMGAQVISGIGFLGVGTIFMTGKNTVQGLTTAAGLWAAACVGLAVGTGFYVGGILATLLILIVLALLHKLETAIFNKTRIVTIYVEMKTLDTSNKLMQLILDTGSSIKDEQLVSISNVDDIVATYFTIQLKNGVDGTGMCKLISGQDGVLFVEIR